jgi:predicted Zn finger-like uncharacterized protein
VIIICEHCESKYNVPADAIGLRGRSVKCIKCTKTWFAKASPTDVEPANIETKIYKKENLPVVQNNKFPRVLSVMISVLFLLNITASMFFFNDFWIKNVPISKRIYSYFGFYETSGLMFRNVAIRNIPTGNSKNLLIRGEIYNDSKQSLYVPDLKVVILSNNKKDVIYQDIIKLSEDKTTQIAPKDTYIINRSLGNIDHEASFIKLDIGDSFSMISR